MSSKCTLTQEPLNIGHTAMLNCSHSFTATAFIAYQARSRSSSGSLSCPNCRSTIKGVLLDRRKPTELEDDGRTIVFKYGKILYNLVVPTSLPCTPDYYDEMIRELLCIPKGRIRFIGKRGTKSFTVIGSHAADHRSTAQDPGGKG